MFFVFLNRVAPCIATLLDLNDDNDKEAKRAPAV